MSKELKAKLSIAVGVTGRKEISAAAKELDALTRAAKAATAAFGGQVGQAHAGFRRAAREYSEAFGYAEKERHRQNLRHIDEESRRRMRGIDSAYDASRRRGALQLAQDLSNIRLAESEKRRQQSATARQAAVAERQARRYAMMGIAGSRATELGAARWDTRRQTLLGRNVASADGPDLQAIFQQRLADIAGIDATRQKLKKIYAAALGAAPGDQERAWRDFEHTKHRLAVDEQKMLRNEQLRLQMTRQLTREHREQLRLHRESRAAGRRALDWAAQRGQGGIFGVSPGLIAGGIAADLGRRGLSSAFDLSRESVAVSSLNAGVDQTLAKSLIRGSLRQRGGDIGSLGASLRDIAGSDFQGADVGKVFNAAQMLAFGNPGLGGDKATNAVITALKAYNWRGDKALDVADMFTAAGPAGRIEVKDIAEHYGKVAGTTSALGIGLADTLAFTSAASLGGLSAEQSFTGLDQVLQSLLMANNSDTKSGAARKLGLGTTSKWVSQHGPLGILEALDSYKRDDKNDLIQQVFSDKDGRRALMSILSAGDLSRYTNAKGMILGGSGSTATKESAVGGSDYGSLEKMKGEFLATLTELGEALMPIAREIMPEVVNGLRTFSSWLNDPQSKETIKNLWETGKALAPWVASLFAFNTLVGTTARSVAGIADAFGAFKDLHKWLFGLGKGIDAASAGLTAFGQKAAAAPVAGTAGGIGNAAGAALGLGIKGLLGRVAGVSMKAYEDTQIFQRQDHETEEQHLERLKKRTELVPSLFDQMFDAKENAWRWEAIKKMDAEALAGPQKTNVSNDPSVANAIQSAMIAKDQGPIVAHESKAKRKARGHWEYRRDKSTNAVLIDPYTMGPKRFWVKGEGDVAAKGQHKSLLGSAGARNVLGGILGGVGNEAIQALASDIMEKPQVKVPQSMVETRDLIETIAKERQAWMEQQEKPQKLIIELRHTGDMITTGRIEARKGDQTMQIVGVRSEDGRVSP